MDRCPKPVAKQVCSPTLPGRTDQPTEKGRLMAERTVIAFVCAMPRELRPLRRRLGLRRSGLGYARRMGDREVIAVVTGMGTALARAAVVRLLAAVDAEWVIVVGITGAIENETP